MFTIKTATGKEYQSDYATALNSQGVGFVRIVGEDFNDLQDVFSNGEEMPLDIFPQFDQVAQIVNEGTHTKLILKKEN